MKFTATPLAGVFIVEAERLEDERGFFARTWSAAEMAAQGLETDLTQCSVSFNKSVCTLRGMHFQREPHAEAKLVRCTMGKIWDVAVDIRPSSPTYLRWTAVELSAVNRRAFYLPMGMAHGFLTLDVGSEVFYQISGGYKPDAAGGLRWNDPAVGIAWPAAPQVIAARDAEYPDWPE